MHYLKLAIKILLLIWIFIVLYLISLNSIVNYIKQGEKFVEEEGLFKNCYIVTAKLPDDNNDLYIKCWKFEQPEFHKIKLAFVNIPNDSCKDKIYKDKMLKTIKKGSFIYKYLWYNWEKQYYWFIIKNWENYNKKLLELWYANYFNQYDLFDNKYKNIKKYNEPYKSCN